MRLVPWLVLLAVPFLVHAPRWLLGLSSDPIYLTGGVAEALPQGGLPGLPGWFDPNAGSTTAALGGFAAKQWLRGIVPWWNPFTGVGMSLAQEAQPAPLFLPFTLLLALPDGVLWNKIALQIVAGFATFALLRELALARWLALLGAVLFALNGTFAWYSHAPINPVPFLPLLLLGLARAARFAGMGRPGGWAWIAIGLAGSLYAGFPEVAFLDGLFAALWSAWAVRSTARPARGRAARKIAIGGGVGLLLAGPAVLPFLQALPDAMIGQHLASDDAAMAPGAWALLLAPYVLGPLDGAVAWPGGYLGLPLVGLGLLALARGRHRIGLRWVLACWILLAVGRSARWGPAVALLDPIPFVRVTMFFQYVVPSLELACLLLACLAIEDWQARGPPRYAALLAAGALAFALLALTLWLARPVAAPLLQAHRFYAVYAAASLLVSLGTLLGVAAVLRGRAQPARRAWLGALLGGYTAAVFALPLLSGTRELPLDRPLLAFLGAHLGLARFYTLGPIQPNWGAWFGVASINHNALPVPRLWTDYIHRHLDPGADPVLFVGYLPPASPGQESRAEAMARRVDAFAGVGVRYIVAPRGTAPFAGASTPPPHVFESSLADIYELPNPATYFEARGAACVLAPRKREAVAADCPAPATLIRRELFDAGWRARVNGAAVPVSPTDEIFQAIALPAGRSEVRFSYAPPFIGWACAGAVLALAGLGVGVWRGRA